MTPLEQRYRRVLRVLPRSYREQWEEEMVDTLLAGLPADDPDDVELAHLASPSLPEVLSVLGLAVRLRVGIDSTSAPHVMWGAALRRVALVGLLVNAALAVAGPSLELWLAGRIPLLPGPGTELLGLWQQPGAGYVVWALAEVLWLVAYLCLLTGRLREARVAAVLALAGAVVDMVMDVNAGATVYLAARVFPVLLAALPVAALVAFGREAPQVRVRPWLLALPLAVVAAVLSAFLMPPYLDALWVDQPGVFCIALAAACALHVGARAAGRVSALSPWPLGLAVLCTAVLGLRLVTLSENALYAGPDGRSAFLLAGAAEAAAVLTGAVLTGVLARRQLRGLPVVRTDPPARSAPSVPA